MGEEENEGDEMEEDLEEDGIESIDEEADKRYWEAKANEGIRKVSARYARDLGNRK